MGMRAARKAMKAMKKVSARLAKRHAFFGKLDKTATGLKKTDLVKNKAGRIVSKKKSLAGKKRVDRRLQQGARGPEDQGVQRDQEGDPLVQEGEGVHGLSTATRLSSVGGRGAPALG